MEKIEEYIIFMTEVFQRNMKMSELSQIKSWDEQEVPFSEITRAYGIMMKACERPSFPYIAKVIENWR